MARHEDHEERPLYDRGLGVSEKAIISKWGRPDDTYIRNAFLFGGELRSMVPRKLSASGIPVERLKNMLVKEMYYKTVEGEQIFWLTKDPKDRWLVFTDVHVPPGVLF